MASPVEKYQPHKRIVAPRCGPGERPQTGYPPPDASRSAPCGPRSARDVDCVGSATRARSCHLDSHAAFVQPLGIAPRSALFHPAMYASAPHMLCAQGYCLRTPGLARSHRSAHTRLLGLALSKLRGTRASCLPPEVGSLFGPTPFVSVAAVA